MHWKLSIESIVFIIANYQKIIYIKVELNFSPVFYVENTKITVYMWILHNFNIFFWECMIIVTSCIHFTPTQLKSWKSMSIYIIIIDREALAKQGDNGIGSVRPSVCPSVHPCVCWVNIGQTCTWTTNQDRGTNWQKWPVLYAVNENYSNYR